MKKKLKLAVRRLLPELTRPPAILLRLIRGRGVRVLMYHRVTDLAGDRLSVKPAEFARQMDFLRARGYRVVPLSELEAALNSSSPALVLTFDDGFRDFYENAYPVLRERKLPAAVFVITGLVEGKVELPRYRNRPGRAEPLTWEMLREMAGGGIVIGSHTLTHRELTGLSPGEAREEIEASAVRIGEKTGARPEWFSYPRGKFGRETVSLVRAAGYRGAVTVRPGSNYSARGLYVLKRTEISGDDTPREFALKLDGAYDIWHYLRQELAGDRL